MTIHERLTKLVQVRISETRHVEWMGAAGRAGLRLSDWLRQVADDAARMAVLPVEPVRTIGAPIKLSPEMARALEVAERKGGQAGETGEVTDAAHTREPVPAVVSPALPAAPPLKPRPIMVDLATAREFAARRKGVDVETGEVREEKLPGKVAMEVRNTWVAANQEGRGVEVAERLASRYPDYAGQIRALVTKMEEGTS